MRDMFLIANEKENSYNYVYSVYYLIFDILYI